MLLIAILKKILFSIQDTAIDYDERIKRRFLSLCFLISIPSVSVFGVWDIIEKRVFEGVLVFIVCSIFIMLLILLNRTRAYHNIIRVCVVIMLGILAYELVTGGGNGAAILWFYFVPSTVFFLLGLKEGLWWIGALVITVLVVIGGKIGYQYPPSLAHRFVTTFSLVVLLAGSVEFLRNRYYQQLLAEKRALQDALDEITMLKGMVPICSSCKKIRDDKGFWMQIESFVREHSELEFSHGICPECATKLYPDSAAAREYGKTGRVVEGGNEGVL